MHFQPLLTGAIALSLWAPQAAAQAPCSTTEQKAAPVTVRLLKSCEAQETAAVPVSLSTPQDCLGAQAPEKAQPVAAAADELDRIFGEEDVTQAEAVRTLAALGYVSDGGNERGYLGVVMDIEDGAMILRQVMDGGPAAKAGLKPGDRITRLGDHKVKNQEALTGFLQGRKAGSDLELRVVRDGWVKEMAVTLAPLSAIDVELAVDANEIEELEEIEEGTALQWIASGDGEEGANLWVGRLGGDDHDEETNEEVHRVLVEHLGKLEHLGDLEHLDKLEHIVKLEDIGDLEHIVKLEHLGDLEHIVKLEDIGVDLKGLHGAIELELGADADLDGLKQRIQARIHDEMGAKPHGDHDIEVHVDHDGGTEAKVRGKIIMIGEDGKKREIDLGDGGGNTFKWDSGDFGGKAGNVMLFGAPHGEHRIELEGHAGAPWKGLHIADDKDGLHEVEVHVEHHGGTEAKVQGKIIMIDEDGKKREIDLGDGGSHTFEWSSRDGGDKKGSFMVFGAPGGEHHIELEGAHGPPSSGFFFEAGDDDDHHHADGDDHHHADDDDHHHAGDDDDHRVERRVIRRRKAPKGDDFFFDSSSGAQDREKEIEVRVQLDSDDEGHARPRTFTVREAPQGRLRRIAGDGPDSAISDLRNELARLRNEIALLREEIQKMHR